MTTTTMTNRLSTLISNHYVFPDVAQKIVAALGSAHPSGTSTQVAAQLTQRIQSVNGDRHLRVRYRESGVLEGASDWEAHYAEDAVRNGGGIRAVERLDSTAGLMVIAPYLSPVHLAEDYVRAAFALLAEVSSLVIDLREGLGGAPETAALICGYLLGDEPVHLHDFVDRAGVARQYWTSPAANRLDASVRICVLTSEHTFSGCEELAYTLQALGRATIIGQRTGGGAHPVETFKLTQRFEVTVPVARSVSAVTASNWEQTGVVPDIDCHPPSALARALRHLDPESSRRALHTHPMGGQPASSLPGETS